MIPEKFDTPVNVFDIPGIRDVDDVPLSHPIFQMLTLKNVYDAKYLQDGCRDLKKKYNLIDLSGASSSSKIKLIKCKEIKNRVKALWDIPLHRRNLAYKYILDKLFSFVFRRPGWTNDPLKQGAYFAEFCCGNDFFHSRLNDCSRSEAVALWSNYYNDVCSNLDKRSLSMDEVSTEQAITESDPYNGKQGEIIKTWKKTQ